VDAAFSLQVDPDLGAIRAARHHIAAHLRLPTDIAADVSIIVGELVANAVLHGAPPIQATVTLDHGILRVAVHDHDAEMGSPTPDSRGLTIVAGLATDWGVTRDGDGGKSVWARLPLPQGNPDLPV
jgi:anti-sigma regulatory factor (Ser/Thr protein kinase)